ncbi:bifunctional diaminohydroxyphosphoribosylaminopyrimidine deaminase/5-amino-6-(5-phosphoribosylamino)uracil reductase RibD [Leptolyngbya sp. FACHB-261]|uniref:bifunctional diaminohydroxyphosphoribosylaminopyrimidine deaminase/5-amino-6-(5-phosphoribosylamino)uracil reductase RibD n=1 Tax=Leptolyngbya sp. FACHB-261 TaxID=2692806 RepID=UPI0016898B89|nr:bifunctional diaminohydroxyphosphoribosylaminopyrimidine deaminase/5-amino-6-(5-phosphoribosylamino)uracil reductase RibD [Leptolyngbya sp. FACHB-261]MBD2103331.1 bifunctional diaminohydroxyphosphoribosylaminopyrimidine deaminase/5-amino-6-(5-phosphoribosylamino)uracil reductase RibD [Leptolyngbya sp. FACHB-261]
MTSPIDPNWMDRCLELAARAQGRTAPNPMVGSVVLQGDQVLGAGFHPGAGQPHAEVFALRAAGEQARGSTLYVNLEPCNHYGRTPPCTEAILQAGVARVVVGMVDPDPRVSGGGIERLRTNGIEVIVGVQEAACQQLNEAFVHRVTQKRPFGILKYAMTLDGHIAAPTGHSFWVTGEAARTEVHRLRSICDAVIVGSNTVRQDNPQLTCRLEAGRNPLRIVMSRSLNLPEKAHLWDTATAPTLVLTEANPDPSKLQPDTHGQQLRQQFRQLLEKQGVEVVELDLLTPKTALDYLYSRGLLTVLWECGGTLAAQAIREGTVQKLLAFIAPKIIGGSGFTPVADLGFTEMTQALQLKQLQVRQLGQDWLFEGYL